MTQRNIAERIVPTLRREGVVKAALFGSIVRGDATKNSDIDILVEFAAGKSLLDLIGLKQILEAQLKRRVDVVTYRSLHPRLKRFILQSQRVIYEKGRNGLS